MMVVGLEVGDSDFAAPTALIDTGLGCWVTDGDSHGGWVTSSFY